jgi:FkbM family methyltransferase
MTDIHHDLEKRQSGMVRNVLRTALASSRWFLPTEPTLKQVKVGDLKVLCWINDHIGRRLFLARSYEPEDIAALKQVIRSGDTVADVGANIGYLSLHFAKFAGPAGRVFSFEPMSHLHPVVTLNASLNGMTDVISVHPFVVSETANARASAQVPEGGAPFAYFQLSKDTDGSEGGNKAKGSSVATVRLDGFAAAAGVKRFDFIKIDVEGGEVSVLRSASGLLADPARRPRALMIEIVDAQLQRFGHRLEDIYAILTPHGYKASIYRGGVFEPVTDPHAADCWNVFFSADPLVV